MMVTINNMLRILLVIPLCLSYCGCQDPRKTATEELRRELAARRTSKIHSMALCRKGLDAQEQGELTRARRHFQEAVKQDDRNARAWTALGILNFEQNDLQAASLAFHRASRLEPNRYEPLFNLGVLLESAGKQSLAIRKYEAALECAPGQVEVMENLARCYIQAGIKRQEVRHLLTMALKSEQRVEWILWIEQRLLELKIDSED